MVKDQDNPCPAEVNIEVNFENLDVGGGEIVQGESILDIPGLGACAHGA